MSRLKKAIESLAAAALEFEEACNDDYKKAQVWGDTRPASFSPEVKIYNRVEHLLNNSIYSRVQWRALQGAIAAWRPPQVPPGQSLPLTGRSGGAA